MAGHSVLCNCVYSGRERERGLIFCGTACTGVGYTMSLSQERWKSKGKGGG